MDVDAGRVVKGTKFIDIRDAGDPVELAAYYDEHGADEVIFLDITATSDKRGDGRRPGAAGGRRGVRPVHDRRRRAHGGGRAGGARRGRGQGRRQLARRSRGPSCVTEMARTFGDQCVVLAVDARRRDDGTYEVVVAGGRTPTGRDAVAWVARGRRARGGGDPADLAWTATAPRTATTSTSSARSRRRSTCRSSRRAASASRSTWSRASRAGADAALAASIFHYGEYSIEETRDALIAAGIPIRARAERCTSPR